MKTEYASEALIRKTWPQPKPHRIYMNSLSMCWISPHSSFIFFNPNARLPCHRMPCLFSLEREREGERKRQSEEEYSIQEDGILENLTGGKNRDWEREQQTETSFKSRIMTKQRQKPVKSLRTTKAVKYGTVSLACVSSCHWTAGPQTRATTTDSSRPGRAYRTHTPLNVHGIMRPALVLITFKENTDTQVWI